MYSGIRLQSFKVIHKRGMFVDKAGWNHMLSTKGGCFVDERVLNRNFGTRTPCFVPEFSIEWVHQRVDLCPFAKI